MEWFSPEDYILGDYLKSPRAVTTGMDRLDQMLGSGYGPGLHVVMGSPGSGKSAYAVQCCFNAAIKGHRVAYFSLEMRPEAVWHRIASLASTMLPAKAAGIMPFRFSDVPSMGRAIGSADPLKTDLTEMLDADPFTRVVRMLLGRTGRQKVDILVTGDGSLRDAAHLAAGIGEACDDGASFIVVDHLQMVSSGAREGKERVDAALDFLLDAALGAKVPLLLVSTMNRTGLRSGSQSMHDGSGSAQIEYDAETVMTLVEEDRARRNVGHRRVTATLHKNRCGESGVSAELDFWAAYNVMTFVERKE